MKQNQSTYMLRILGGGYLVYLGITLVSGISLAEGVMQLIEMICVVLFCTAGALLCLASLKELMKMKKAEGNEESNNIEEK